MKEHDATVALPLAYHTPGHYRGPAPTPPEDYPSLDAWLDAERAGRLAHVPVREPFFLSVYSAAWHLGIIPPAEVQLLHDRMSAAWNHRKPWPRACSQCGAEFRPSDGRQVKAKRPRCPDCRNRRKVAK